MTDETLDTATMLPVRAEHDPAARRGSRGAGAAATAVLIALLALALAGYAAWRTRVL